MKIRKAKPEDSAEIARLHRGTIRSINAADYSPEDIDVWSGRAKADRVKSSHKIAVRYVAVEKGKIIGFVDIGKEKPEDLWGLYVHKDWVGQGVGTKLLNKIEEVARKMGAKKFIATSTVTAKRFYEARGFTVIRKKKHQIEHRKLDVYVMEKSLMSHSFIIIRGALGVGKTTIAKRLSKKLGALYVSIDDVLAQHNLDTVEGECIPAKNFIKGNEIALPVIQQSLNNGRPVVIDGCFYHEKQIQHFIDSLGVPYFVFTLKAPVEVCIERDAGRKKPYGKYAALAVYSLVSRFDYGTNIDVNGDLEDVIQKILSYLPVKI